MSSYRVVYERDESGAWLARVPSVPGCHTYGRTIEQARERVREALGLWVSDAAESQLHEGVRLPTAVRISVRRARRARARAEAEHNRAQSELQEAASSLTRGLRLSLRDAGELLGVSRQRVQQLVHQAPSKLKRRARSGLSP